MKIFHCVIKFCALRFSNTIEFTNTSFISVASTPIIGNSSVDDRYNNTFLLVDFKNLDLNKLQIAVLFLYNSFL